MFTPGQKIIAINNHPDSLFRKGEFFIVKDVIPSKCPCHAFLVHVGYLSNPLFFHTCQWCKGKFKHDDMIRWFSNIYFAPVEHAYADLVLEGIREQKLEENLIEINI